MRITDILTAAAVMFILPLILALAALTAIRWETVKLEAEKLCDTVSAERGISSEQGERFEKSVLSFADISEISFGCIRKIAVPGENGEATVYTQRVSDSRIRECIDRNGCFRLSPGELFTVSVTFSGNGLWERFASAVTGITVPVCCACSERAA